MTIARRTVLFASLGAALMALAGCGKGPRFNTTDIADSGLGKNAPALAGSDGQRHRFSDFTGRAVVVFFGYTQCPDVCPTSLMMLKDVLGRLGADAARVQVIFVTVDPQRDTPPQLAAYMQAFDPGFLALRGNDDETAAVARAFKVYYRKQGDVAGGRYTVDHTAGCYVFDPSGRIRLFARHGETAERLAADLRLLLAGH